jgi:hypothetical protein
MEGFLIARDKSRLFSTLEGQRPIAVELLLRKATFQLEAPEPKGPSSVQ